VSVVRACRLAQFSRAAWYKKSTARDQTPLRLRIRELALARPRFGYTRIWVLLRRDGWPVNRKRVRRLYRLDGLQVRMRVRRRKHLALHRGPVPVPEGPIERWSRDFVHDALADGTPFRARLPSITFYHGSQDLGHKALPRIPREALHGTSTIPSATGQPSRQSPTKHESPAHHS
jgi:transposase InsO family protein